METCSLGEKPLPETENEESTPAVTELGSRLMLAELVGVDVGVEVGTGVLVSVGVGVSVGVDVGVLVDVGDAVAVPSGVNPRSPVKPTGEGVECVVCLARTVARAACEFPSVRKSARTTVTRRSRIGDVRFISGLQLLCCRGDSVAWSWRAGFCWACEAPERRVPDVSSPDVSSVSVEPERILR
jgi:hypothetical protein